MTNRWQVRVHQSHTNGAKNPKNRWVVDPPGFDYKRRARHTGDWQRAGGKWFQWGREVTKREAWEEALAYADRMGRTVEVTLPRVHVPWRTKGIFGEQDLAPLTFALLAGNIGDQLMCDKDHTETAGQTNQVEVK